MIGLTTVAVCLFGVALGYPEISTYRNYTEFERTMIINQREIIFKLNDLEPAVRLCRAIPPENDIEFEEIDILDRKGRLPDFEHNMIHYQRTIMSQIRRVVEDAKVCRQDCSGLKLHFTAPKEIHVPLPQEDPIKCKSDQHAFEGKCISFKSDPMTWEQAEVACRSEGGTLAEPRDTNAFIVLTTEARKDNYALSRSIWIGANGKAYKRVPNQAIVTAYGINCPTVHFFPGGGDDLSDFPCRYQRSFACQVPGDKQ